MTLIFLLTINLLSFFITPSFAFNLNHSSYRTTTTSENNNLYFNSTNNYPVFILANSFEAYFPSKPKLTDNEFLREKNILHYSAADLINKITVDATKFILPIYINRDNYNNFVDNFINGELMSTDGELFHKRKTIHNGIDAFYYTIIYKAYDTTVIKYVALFAKDNELFKWSVQGFIDISELEASQLFFEKKKFFRLIE